MGEKELSPEETQAFKQELEDIKNEQMRRELEEIKKERMRKELEEIKREKEAAAPAAQPRRMYASTRAPELSIVNVIFAALSLLIAGYLIGTLYVIDVTATVNSLLTGYNLPAVVGSIVVAILAVLLALFGAGMITIAKK